MTDMQVLQDLADPIALLRELVAVDPWVAEDVHDGRWLYCVFCNAERHCDDTDMEHAAVCPWVRGKAVLAQIDGARGDD